MDEKYGKSPKQWHTHQYPKEDILISSIVYSCVNAVYKTWALKEIIRKSVDVKWQTWVRACVDAFSRSTKIHWGLCWANMDSRELIVSVSKTEFAIYCVDRPRPSNGVMNTMSNTLSCVLCTVWCTEHLTLDSFGHITHQHTVNTSYYHIIRL